MATINEKTQALEKRKTFDQLRSALRNERSSFESHWRDLSDFILPRRSRFFVADANRGDRRSNKIIDSTATIAARTLRSGMMAGITSPARPWFRLTTSDNDLSEVAAVKEWLHIVGERMRTSFLRSNIYNALPVLYGDMGVFGTAAIFIEEDFDSVLRAFPLPIGSYMIANDDKLQVRTFYREFRLSVRQVVKQFGGSLVPNEIDWTNISTHVHNLFNENHLDAWIDISHVVESNPEFDPDREDSKFKRFRSVYFETGTSPEQRSSLTSGEKEKFLRESGYDIFPVLAPRWEVSGEDIYGTTCPGMEALGDIKQLQTGEKRSAQAIEKMVNPPMVAPTSLRTVRTSLLPGDVTYSDEREGQRGFRPAHEVNPRVQELEGKQEQVRQRIRRVFFEDLFLMLASSTRRQITAREIEERHEEKLLALGPVLEQLNQDLLDPLIDITFDIMVRQGLVPDPPEELQGQDLKVEYISTMAQAQKLVGVSGMERFLSTTGQIVTASPEVADKIDLDQFIDRYGDQLSIPPDLIRPDEEVAEIRAKRAEAQQAQAQAEQVQLGAKAAKDLSGANLEEDNALKRLIDQQGA